MSSLKRETDGYETFQIHRPINNCSRRPRRCKALTRRLFSIFFFFVLFLVALWSCIVMAGAQLLNAVGPPHPASRKDWTGLKNQTWAVGMDLSAGYGTASVAFNNGTIVEVARWKGDGQYVETMKRLSLQLSAHPTPPYYNRSAQWNDLGRQWKRWWNKKRGVPASEDVRVLFSVMLRLEIDANAWLKRNGMDWMQVVFVTVPPLPALYNEDLVDAADLHGLQLLTLPWYIVSLVVPYLPSLSQ
jgi:hypothetical protein